MEAARTSGTSVNIYKTTRRNISEDSYLHTRRRENLKSHPSVLKIDNSVTTHFLNLLRALHAVAWTKNTLCTRPCLSVAFFAGVLNLYDLG
jgi:hypothetical protein